VREKERRGNVKKKEKKQQENEWAGTATDGEDKQTLWIHHGSRPELLHLLACCGAE